MKDYRTYLISVIIAVLFAIFVFTSIDAVYPQPEFPNHCAYPDRFQDNVTETQREQLFEQQRIAHEQCIQPYYDAQQSRGFILFIISSLIGVLAIVGGLFLPTKKATQLAVATGLLLGGLFVVFLGTMQGWSSLHPLVKPLVILIEIGIVIVVSFKTLDKK